MRQCVYFVAILLVTSEVSQSLCQDLASKDPLKEAQARLAVSQARAESLFREQIREYDEWYRKDPEKARLALDAADKIIQGEQAIPEKRRTVLLDQVAKKRSGLASTRMTDPLEGASTLSKPKVSKPALTETEKQQIETSRQLREIIRLGDSGKSVEANRRLAELSRKDSGNPAVVAANQMSGTRGAIQNGRDLNTRINSSMLGALREIEAAGVPIVGDMALGSSMSLTMEGEQLKYFLDAMEKQLGIPLVIDKQALETAGIGLETPINIRARNWSARSVLRKVFSDLGIAYIIRSEEVQVTTQETARETMVTRSYYIGDLLPIFGNNNVAGLNNVYMDPFSRMNMVAASQAQFSQTLTGIVDSIKSQVDPSSWAPNGQGSIVFEPLSMSLIVKQTAEVHFLLGTTLR
jgi:hypothetical protein